MVTGIEMFRSKANRTNKESGIFKYLKNLLLKVKSILTGVIATRASTWAGQFWTLIKLAPLCWPGSFCLTHKEHTDRHRTVYFEWKKNILRPSQGAKHRVAQTVPIQYKCWWRTLTSFLCHPRGNKPCASGNHMDETYFWATSTYLSKFLTSAWYHLPRAMSLETRSSRSLQRSIAVPILVLHLKVTEENSP